MVINMSNPIERFESPKVTKLELPDNKWLEIEEKTPGHYEIIAENISGPDDSDHELGMASADEEFKNLDLNGDHDFLGASVKGKFRGVTFDLPYIDAPSLDAIRDAVKHIDFFAFNPQDV